MLSYGCHLGLAEDKDFCEGLLIVGEVCGRSGTVPILRAFKNIWTVEIVIVDLGECDCPKWGPAIGDNPKACPE